MASVAVSNIVQLNFNFGRLSIDGFPIEVYRIIGGVAAADTATIAPNRFDKVKSVIAPGAVTDLPTTDVGATNVTLTFRQSAATNQTIDVFIIGEQRN